MNSGIIDVSFSCEASSHYKIDFELNVDFVSHWLFFIKKKNAYWAFVSWETSFCVLIDDFMALLIAGIL